MSPLYISKGQPLVGSFCVDKVKMTHFIRIYSEGVQQEANYDLAKPLFKPLEFKMINHKQ